jgi:hypothetical protein
MRLIALVAAAVLTALPALAQAPGSPPVPPGLPMDSKLPLAAMRHQQPREADVEERLGPKAQEVDKQQRPEVDRLYDDVMRRSALPASGQ